MNTVGIKSLTIFIVPALLLGLAFWVLPQIPALPPARQELIVYLPYLLIVTGMFLSLHFHRGRAFFVLLLLAGFYWSFRSHLQGGPTGISGRILHQSFCTLIPFNIAIFSLMRERGVITIAGRLRGVFLALQAFLLSWAMQPGHVDIQHLLAWQPFQGKMLSSIFLPPISLPVLCLGLLIVAAKTAIKQSPIDSGFFGAMAASAIACNGIVTANVTPLFISTAAATLALSVLQDSYNMAFRDDLTTLPSRRALNEQLTWLGRQYTIAMLDVDHFKKFNDTYGHDVGDQVLKMVAGKMRHVTGGGKAYRYGGEEFTVLFPRQHMADVLPHLEELRKTIADYKLWLRSVDRPSASKEGRKLRKANRGEAYVSVTISIGVAESGNGQKTPSMVIKAADDALYRAKNRGRNQVST